MTAVPSDTVDPPVSDVPGCGGKRPRLGHRGKVALAVVATLVAAYLIAAALLFVWPTIDRPQPAGAVLSLNGRDEPAREQLAVSLVEKGYAPVLLFSQGHAMTRCPSVPHVTVVCFPAHPDRTVGEIDFAVRYARAHGIDSILIASGHTQVTRARLLAHRCFAGRVTVDAAPMPWWRFPYEIVYETGALFKATVIDGGCS